MHHPQPNRRNQIDIAADENPIADFGPAFGAVVVGGNHPATNIRISSHPGIADICQVRDFGSLTD